MIEPKCICFSKLQSSTLIEVLVGMTIIMITMGIVFPMILKSQHESAVIERSKATMIGNSLLEKTIANQDFSDYEYEDEQIKVSKTVEKDVFHENARNIRIQITTLNGLVLYEQEYYALLDDL